MSVSSLVLVVALVAFAMYRRQVISYLTHWKGGPTQTQPYQPFATRPVVHLAVAGDTGDSGTKVDRLGVAMDGIEDFAPYDALLLLGDNVYPSGDPARVEATVFEPFGAVLDEGTALLAIVGNHDAPHGDEQMRALGMPGRYWAKSYDDVLMIGLDSTTIDDPDQLDFLENALATSTATWKIVALHHPPYSAGYQGSRIEARETFGPLFERYGVQLVLSGHDHDYQRSVPINGVTYIVSGAGSGTRRTAERDFTAVAYSFIHFLDIGIFGDHLEVRAVGTDGRVADHVAILPTTTSSLELKADSGRIEQQPLLGCADNCPRPVDRARIDRDRIDAEADQLFGELRPVRWRLSAQR